MLSFGKSFSDGRKQMISRRWFDRLVQAGTRVGENSFTDTTYEYVSKAKRKVAQESAGKIIAPEWDGDDDYQHKSAELTLQRARSFRQWDIELACEEVLPWNKVRPLRKRLFRSDMFLESNPDGEEKMTTKQAIYDKIHASRYRRAQDRNAHSWKNKSRMGIGRKSGRVYVAEQKEKLAGARDLSMWDFERKNVPHHVADQWARHQPKAHCAWSIGEEMAAGFVIEECKKLETGVKNEEEAEREYGYAQEYYDTCYHMEENSDHLHELYDFGEWNLEPSTLGFSANRERERAEAYHWKARLAKMEFQQAA